MGKLRIFLLALAVAAASAIFLREDLVRQIERIWPLRKVKILEDLSFKDESSLSLWGERVLSDKKTDYAILEYKGRKCARAASDGSASARYVELRIPPRCGPVISWDWAVEKFPEYRKGEAIGKKEEFDFAAQVYVIFYAKNFLASKAIQYVWSEKLPPLLKADSPYTGNVKVLVLESGLSDGWKHEERNIAEDYKMLFGSELKSDISYVAFMTDADSTRSSASAYFADIKVSVKGG